MLEAFWGTILRHRVAIQDLWLVIAVGCSAVFFGFEFELSNEIAEYKRFSFEKMLAAGGIITFSIIIFAYRRMAAQEQEIGRRSKAEHLAYKLAHTDMLTGLPNRRQFEVALEAALGAAPGLDEMHAVFMLDLNGFKKINDVYGHATGDRILVEVSERLASLVRDGDLAARFGGDEFAIIARQVPGAEAAAAIGMRIIECLERPIEIESARHKVGIGIGIAIAPKDGETPDVILRKADIALYQAKEGSHSSLRFFDEGIDEQARQRDLIERELAAAIGTDAMRPWYQPIVDLRTEAILGFEALARWDHSSLGSIPPDQFIPIAEECDLIDELGDHLLRKACCDARNWPDYMVLSFNISALQLKDGALWLRIRDILNESQLPPHRLEIEITESALILDFELAKQTLCSLRTLGVRLALDDFGTGYAGLKYLRNFKFDTIKIDHGIVGALDTESESVAIVEALSALGHGLGLVITAEGIESRRQLAALVARGCQRGQGFLFGKAVPALQTHGFISRQM